MSATRDELLQAVLAAPADVEPRMVLGDWYMQQGDPRGELIAAQCRLAGRGLSPSTRAFLMRRERELLAEHEDAWTAPARAVASSWTFRRGFIEAVTAGAEPLLTAWETLWSVEPVMALELTGASAEIMERLAGSPLLARIRRLTVRGRIGDDGAAALAGSLHAHALERLNLKDCGIGDDGAAALAGARMPALRSLALTANPIGDDGARALAESPLLDPVQALFLSRTSIGDDGVIALARSPHVRALDTLGLGTLEELGDDGGKALIDSSQLVSLRRLEVDVCYELSRETIKALRKRWPRLRA